ncbi:unnamed protein product [Mytilus edulis]|uniref:Uncharacterized protein n=1 Tax=Mytilus edulis TaxID=6550 RepID=A0A8S3SYY6_MYTED|nr:unnamed protein product [Mytilus edulis]
MTKAVGNMNVMVFFVPEDCLQMYIKRVFSDMTKSVYVPVNRNSENQAFRDNLNVYINSLSEDIFATLIQTASSKFISRLYLSKEENITEIRSRELECSLVLVPMKYCEMFKQKLEDKLKWTSICDNTGNAIKKFKIENDSFPLNLTTLEKKDSDDVLMRMKTKMKKYNCQFFQASRKYSDPLFTCKTIKYCIRSTKGLERIYIQRMIGDWIEGHIYDVFACEGGFTNIVSLLLTCEPKVINNRTLDGTTCLFVSCLKGHDDVVSTLLTQKGIHKDKCILTGMSPLYVASLQRHSNVVEILLSNNANADICIKNKDTVEQVLEKYRYTHYHDIGWCENWEDFYLEKCIQNISKLIIDNASEHVKSYIDASEEDWVEQLILGHHHYI